MVKLYVFRASLAHHQEFRNTQAHTTDTSLFISHTTNVLLFKFRCSTFIGVRLIKEMSGSVASGTSCILSSVAYPAIPYFASVSHIRQDFLEKKKVTEHKMCVLIFCTTFFSEAFLILRRVRRDIIIRVYRYSSKVQVILAGF